MDRMFRRAVISIDQLKSAFIFQTNRLFGFSRTPLLVKEPQGLDKDLLAVYCLKSNPLTFDFVTFLGIAEMERIRRGLSNTKVVIYAPAEFPIYQWQRRKVFNNMGGKSLIWADRKHILAYVRKLADTARIFSQSMTCEVVGERREFLAKTQRYSQVFPNVSNWTGNYPQMTSVRIYSILKHTFNEGRDAVTGYLFRQLGVWWSNRIGGDKLVVTVNLRNQIYSINRNADLERWDEFLSDPFIEKHFHFIVFNDAENAVTLQNTGCVTYCDRYIHDNFRRNKTFLSVGLHIGAVSGSAGIVMVCSDIPYLFIGALDWQLMKPHLDPERYSVEEGMLFFNRDKRYQFFSLRRGPIIDDFHILLSSISACPTILKMYPVRFREKLNEVLQDWPA